MDACKCMPDFLGSNTFDGHGTALVIVGMVFDVVNALLHMGRPAVPTLFDYIHCGETFPYLVDELHIPHIFPGLDIVRENVLGCLVVRQEQEVCGLRYQSIQHLFWQQLQLLNWLAEQPCGGAVGCCHISCNFLQIPGKLLNIAHYHHGREAAILGAMAFFQQLGCQDGEKQRDGGGEDNHTKLFPEAAF